VIKSIIQFDLFFFKVARKQPDVQLQKQQNIETQITKDNKQETMKQAKRRRVNLIN